MGRTCPRQLDSVHSGTDPGRESTSLTRDEMWRHSDLLPYPAQGDGLPDAVNRYDRGVHGVSGATSTRVAVAGGLSSVGLRTGLPPVDSEQFPIAVPTPATSAVIPPDLLRHPPISATIPQSPPSSPDLRRHPRITFVIPRSPPSIPPISSAIPRSPPRDPHGFVPPSPPPLAPLQLSHYLYKP